MSSTIHSSYIGAGLTHITGSNATNGSVLSWSNPMYTDTVVISSQKDESAVLHVQGPIKMKNGDLLDERLERIESLLEIPTRDLELEREFPKLRELWNAYTEELEKYKTWKKIKDSK